MLIFSRESGNDSGNDVFLRRKMVKAESEEVLTQKGKKNTHNEELIVNV